jgi:hypothetical protein
MEDEKDSGRGCAVIMFSLAQTALLDRPSSPFSSIQVEISI